MIQYVFNDLFLEEADYLMEQKNCFHIHGGLSSEMARRYPKAAQADLATKKGDLLKLGTYEVVDCEDIKVINAYGQYGIGGQATDYNAWDSILFDLTRELPKGSVIKIPFLMGCGLGGGNWLTMEGLFVDYFFKNEDLTLKICIREQDRRLGEQHKQLFENFEATFR